MQEAKSKFSAFSDTGRFMSAVCYAEKNPDSKIDEDCTDVVHYSGGYFIQLMDSGIFKVNESFSSRSLDEAETYLFKEIINKKMIDS